MKIGAIIQARTSSSRLPGKVLKCLPYDSTTTVLYQVVRRVKRSRSIRDIVIATTLDKEDDAIVTVARKAGVKYFRGSKVDVLERYYLAAKANKLDIVVRITSDCPCIDAEVVDLVANSHIQAKAEYSSNTLHRTFPLGMDVEVLNFSALEKTHIEAHQVFEREHVCPYIYKSHPDKFIIKSVDAPGGYHAPDIRVTLDTEEDYALLCTIYDSCYTEDNFFGLKSILKLFSDKPWLHLINNKVAHKKILDTLDDELLEAINILDMQGLYKAKEFLVKQRGIRS